MKTNLCYVIPERTQHTHFAYLDNFVKNCQDIFELFIVVEKGSGELPIGILRGYKQRFSFMPFRVTENFLIFFLLRIRGYRTFYVHYSFLSAFNASLVARVLGGRVFYWNAGMPWLYQRNPVRKLFEQTVYQVITFLVTGTEGLKREYARHYNISLEKIKVLPNWIDVKDFQFSILNFQKEKKSLRHALNIPDGAKVILFVHRLSKRKGAHYIPEIVEKLKNESVVLLIVGDGPERDSLKLKIENWKLADKTRFLGWIPQNEVIKYYSISDIFIMPSEEEGFPHVLLEAMAAEVPFVAFRVGGVSEILSKDLQKYAVEPGNLSLFINQIQFLLYMSSEHVRMLQKKEEACVRQFDLSIVKKRFQELFL